MPLDDYRHGRLIVEKLSSYCVEVFCIPSKENLELSGLHQNKSVEHRVKLLEIDGQNGCITIFPTNMRGDREDFLRPKYDQIKRITLADGVSTYFRLDSDMHSSSDEGFRAPYWGSTIPLDQDEVDFDSVNVVPSTQKEVIEMLEGLPSAFTKDYDYGLGLAKPYRFIVNAVERLSDCTEIVISKTHETEIDQNEKRFYISFNDFEAVRKSLNRINYNSLNAARSVKEGTAYNSFAKMVGQPNIPVAVGRHPLRRLFTAAAQDDESLSDEEKVAMLGVVERNVKSIAKTTPEKLVRLQSGIELATLENLITRYEEMINQTINEDSWQTFLNENPFILSLAFGYPIIKIQDQASVGGRKLSGAGEKITDFLVKNSMTNNAAIIETERVRSIA